MNHPIKKLVIGIVNSPVQALASTLSVWAMTAFFSTANAATSFIPPLPQPKKVQPAPAVVSQPIQAPPKTLTEYWGLSYNILSIDNPGISSSSPKVFMVKVGHHLSNSLALETRIAIPTVDETVTWNGQSANQRVNVLAELQLRKGFINVQGVEAYGLFGLSYTNLSTAVIQSSTLQQTNRENTDLSYGLGIRGRLGKTNMMGYAEYNRLLGQSHFNLSRVTLGIDYYF